MHHSDGIFLACGANIKTNYAMQPASITDVAPTLLSYLQLAVPNTMDGKVIQEIFQTPLDTKYHDPGNPTDTPGKQGNFTETEQQQISDRLRNLGYL